MIKLLTSHPYPLYRYFDIIIIIPKRFECYQLTDGFFVVAKTFCKATKIVQQNQMKNKLHKKIVLIFSYQQNPKVDCHLSFLLVRSQLDLFLPDHAVTKQHQIPEKRSIINFKNIYIYFPPIINIYTYSAKLDLPDYI